MYVYEQGGFLHYDQEAMFIPMMDTDDLLYVITRVCKKISELFQTPVLYCDENNIEMSDYASGIVHPYVEDTKVYFQNIFEDTEYSMMPVIKKTEEHIYYFALNLHYESHYYGKIIVGPSLKRRMIQKEMKILFPELTDLHILSQYYSSIKLLDEQAFSTYVELSLFVVEEIYDAIDRAQADSHQKFIKDHEEQQIQEIINQKVYWQTGANIEKILFECIKNGYPEELKKYLEYYFDYTVKKEFLNNNIRNQKDFSIIFIATLAQAAIEGGMDFKYANKYCLQSVKTVENKMNITEIQQFNAEIAYDLANQINMIKRKNQTKLIRDCKDYINNNIFAELKVYEIAEIFCLNEKYLASKFKEETQETMKNYINRKKVEQAKRMIQASDITLSEIATYLSFADQSHFTRIFKKFAQVTPHEYKRNMKS